MKKKLKLRREVIVNLSQLTTVVGAASADTFCGSVCVQCSLFTCGVCPTDGCPVPRTIQRCTFGTC